MTNFIPQKTKAFNDREPPWVNKKVKTMVQEKKTDPLYLKNTLYLENKSNILASKLERHQNWYIKPWKPARTSTTETS